MERRNTIQRKLVLDTVRNLDHPNAEQVYGEIITKHPHISKATVYRNLNLLAAQNAGDQHIIPQFQVPDGNAGMPEPVSHRKFHHLRALLHKTVQRNHIAS